MGIKVPSDFEWLKQTRMYFREHQDKVSICITDVELVYANEFLGCRERLVITPLTDRCYITLAQALNMNLGGAPAGPAGTGKTETVKDMGRTLGTYVVVFNCSDQMDFRGLGRIFKGLTQSGAWGCFDEFNRIALPVLSVAAQQISVVLAAKRDGKATFIFSDGDEVRMDTNFGLFLTMNPGYAGRQELPENLKINFRGVSMMVPDKQIIIRVKLASCGYVNNILLAKKFFILYKLCDEQLTRQVHYDFGLRNILSVLRILGHVRRANPEDSEEKIVMRTLRDMNLSKLVDQDEPLFGSLIEDLFPNIILTKFSYPDLQVAIANRLEEVGLINHPPWNLKVIQLYETQRVRHGIMTLGPTGTGKTCCIKTLMAAMSACEEPHREMRMNPKAITAPQMFGRLDVSSNDWTDGIFSTLWRRTLKTKRNDNVWIVLDGPVDAIWIENLNSVLDDNKTLTLANGDRIPMAPNCKLIFEVHSIDNASPATVSRNGMIFLSSSVLNWKPLVEAWLKRSQPALRDAILPICERLFTASYNYITQSLNPKMAYLEACYADQFVQILEGFLSEEHESENDEYVVKCTMLALMWSLGALLDQADQMKLEEFWRSQSTGEQFTTKLPKTLGGLDNIFNYKVLSNGQWEHWAASVENFSYPKTETPEYASLLVPNVDNTRTEYLLNLILRRNRPVLLIGESGSAKTVMINHFMVTLPTESYVCKTLNFSSATIPLVFQRAIESYVEKRVGTTYGAPSGKKLVVFIDDISMPRINEWGDQVANEIVRQTIEMKGFYTLEKPGDFTTIADINYIAAMIHPGGGRNDIPERLKRQFVVLNCNLPSDASMDKIFGTIASGHYCTERGFSEEVVKQAQLLVPLTRAAWQLIKQRMLPTPEKFHYQFNLRDLSRVWQGMIDGIAEVVSSKQVIMLLWRHEMTRVIADRFIDKEDVLWFHQLMDQVDISTAELRPDCSKQPVPISHFADFLRDEPEPTGEEAEDFDFSAPKIYEPVDSFDSLNTRLLRFLDDYNQTHRGGAMPLVLFRDAMISLLIIRRILRYPRGNALLVGVGGSGRRSLTKLASYISEYKVFQIVPSRSYTVNSLMDDLKALYRIAGMEGKPVVFLFSDRDIVDETFLEYVNNMLSSGFVAGLFSKDEFDEILGGVEVAMKKEFPRRMPDREALVNYYIARCRKNLHVVLCFSPVGEKLRSRALHYPGLISGCTINWFQKWPQEALLAVAHNLLDKVDFSCTADIKQSLFLHLAEVHDGVALLCAAYYERYRRTVHLTPKSFLFYLRSYARIYARQKSRIIYQIERLSSGLQKLEDAQVAIAQLNVQLTEKEKELAVANAAAQLVLNDVMEQTKAAEAVKERVQQVKDECQVLVHKIESEKLVAEGKLEAARPALEQAEKALATIKSADISTVRKLAKPPFLIQRIMDAVLILFLRRLELPKPDPERPGFIKASWSESLKMMASSNFLGALLNFPKDTINEEMIDLLEPLLNRGDYNLETAQRVCGNVAGLLSWTLAMEKFYWINSGVLPLKFNLAKLKNTLDKANRDLATVQVSLDEKEAVLAEVRIRFDEANEKKRALEMDAAACRRRMDTATTLIEGLSGEKTRWTIECKELRAQIGRLVGDVVYACSFLCYSGPFNQQFRNQLQLNWRKMLIAKDMPLSEKLDVIRMLSTRNEVAEWNLEGLPSDELSVQNAIIVKTGHHYPLFIDPQNQGKRWILNNEAKNGLVITNAHHKMFRTHIEDALSFGRPLMIDNAEDIDPSLENVLEKNFVLQGTSLKVFVSDRMIDVAEGFQLYLNTKAANPVFPAEVFALTTVIDFSVTQSGLEDQLLASVIKLEKEELETQRIQLVANMTANHKRVSELEDSLLYRLATTKGQLVDDLGLVEVLQVTKQTTIQVEKQLALAAEMEHEISTAREEYRPVAARGSLLYFLMNELSGINPMYHTGLARFELLFQSSITNSELSSVTTKRIENIIQYLTHRVWSFLVLGMFKLDRKLASLLLAIKVDIQRQVISSEEFTIFLQGGASLDLRTLPPKPGRWIVDMTWLNLNALARLREFAPIIQSVQNNERTWRHWFDREAPEDEPLPCGFETLMTPFKRLLTIRCWCPDRAMQLATKYISHTLGRRFTVEPFANLDVLCEESDPRFPLFGLLSMGADPTPEIEAKARKDRRELYTVSMGQGQEVHARRYLKIALTEGHWVLLQNCHLCLDYIIELFNMFYKMQAKEGSDKKFICKDATGTELEVVDTFRLWITSEENDRFPIMFLQIAIKFTSEPPEGIQANVRRTYSKISQSLLDNGVTFHWRYMLYALAFFHCTVQERRKYGPLGWCIPYEFNQSDFNASIMFLQNYLDAIVFKKAQKQSNIDWKCVRYMLADIQYGGRVTDDFDHRLIITLSKFYFLERIFQSNFHFYRGYNIPKCTQIEEYLTFIDKEIPSKDNTYAIGLHPNADITYQTQTTKHILETIVSILPKESSASSGKQVAETRETIVRRICKDMLSKLPAAYVPHKVQEQLKMQDNLKPLTIFLRQEVDRMDRVLRLTDEVLNNLILAIDGSIVMNELLSDTLDCLFEARVPNLWAKKSWSSATLGFWFTELIERTHQFNSWLNNGRPACYWMTGFFNAQGFITAMKQEVSRLNSWALDTIELASLFTKWNLEDVREGAKGGGVYVHGLFLEGSSWDRRQMKLVAAKSKILYEPMPVIYLFAQLEGQSAREMIPPGTRTKQDGLVPPTSSSKSSEKYYYICPIYRKPKRTELTYVDKVEIASLISSDILIIRGVALLCDIK